METVRQTVRTALWISTTVCLLGATLASAEILTLDTRQNRALARPRAAFNTIDKLYLAVWEYHYGASDWDIQGRVLDANGLPLGSSFGIAYKGSVVQQEPDVAYNPVTNQFLVAYALAPDNWKISACIVDGNGVPGGFVPIATSIYPEYHPAVACDPISGEYLVAYERELQLDNTVWREVWAQRVNPDGSLHDTPFQVSSPGVHSLECAVACAGGQFMVVWREVSPAGNNLIMGKFFYPQTGNLPESPTLLSWPGYQGWKPQVTYNADTAEYLTVYQSTLAGVSPMTYVSMRRINPLGELRSHILIGSSPGNRCVAPDVAYIPADGQYLVTWAQSTATDPAPLASHQIMALRVDSQIHQFGDRQTVSGPAKNQPIDPGVPAPAVVAGTCGRALIVWEDQAPGSNSSTTVYSILASHGSWGCGCE